MIGYVMLGVDDLSKAREFYDPLLAMLGAVPGDWSNERSTFYVSQPGKPMFAITKPYNGQPASAGQRNAIFEYFKKDNAPSYSARDAERRESESSISDQINDIF